jgi:hypothetical protein
MTVTNLLHQEAEQLGLKVRKKVSAVLDTGSSFHISAKGWVETIQHFLKLHRLDDADISIDCWESYDGYEKTITVYAHIDKTDDELRAEIDAKKTETHRRQTEQLDKEFAEYERLRKKFERP